MDLYTPSNHPGPWLDLSEANVPDRTVGELVFFIVDDTDISFLEVLVDFFIVSLKFSVEIEESVPDTAKFCVMTF